MSIVQIVEISASYAEDEGEEADGAHREAADAAHAVLMALCTEPGHGLAGAGAAEEHDPDEGGLGGGLGSNPAGAQGSAAQADELL